MIKGKVGHPLGSPQREKKYEKYGKAHRIEIYCDIVTGKATYHRLWPMK